MTTTDYRLSKDITPRAYAIHLFATPKKMTFSGTVRISLKSRVASEVVELHARDLTVGDVVAIVGKKKIKGKAKLRKDRETVELRFPKELPKGAFEITTSFKGKLNPSMHGLYLAKDGDERAIVSQCEATDARGIFPCFDEPEHKATFQWTVTTDAGLTVITNGVPKGVKKVRVSGKPAETHAFGATRIISSYLVAVTIGKLEASKKRIVAKIPCRAWAGPGKGKLTDFAQDVTAQVLPWYEKYFGQKYNYQKLDQVAVPGFDAGAMENVGAIFYRQNLLLMQPGATSWTSQKRIAEVIAHELAHQWFGNLVTMKWWDDLWLNEAFATWIAYKAVDVWQPTWRMWDDYLESKESALAADALVNTHPVYTPVKTPAEATELFDVITYEKGCAVLRMCEAYLGDAVFQKGIKAYQTEFKNKNAAGADLWRCLADASGEPVGELMRSWVEQEGFPLVTVSAAPGMADSGGKTTLTLKQRRFFSDAGMMKKGTAQVWTIPIVIRYSGPNGIQTHRHLMRNTEETVDLPAGVRWVHANASAGGFYRVQMDALMRARLLTAVADLAPSERMTLIEDQWALVRNGESDVGAFLDVLSAFRGDNDHIVTRSMTKALSSIHSYLVGPAEEARFAELVRWFFSPQLESLGMETRHGEPEAQGVRRASIVYALGELGRDPKVLAEAARLVAREMEDPTAVDPNLAGTLVALGAVKGDNALLDSYVRVYLARKEARSTPDLQARYLGALSAFEDKKANARVLAMCLDETVPQEQLRVVIAPMLSRKATQRGAWEFLKKHWSAIGPRVGSMGVARLVESTGSLPADLEEDVDAFFTKHPVEEAKRALQKALEAMRLKAELSTREANGLRAWLLRDFTKHEGAARSA
ncbi:MAG: M1 family metallopeptidase [Myxococcota bacterium]